MSAPRELPYFTITQAGVAYDIPVQATPQRDGTDRPVPVARNPKIAFPPPLVMAGPDGAAARRNYDIDEIVLSDWSGGLSVDVYPSTAPPSGYAYGELDTRRPGYLTPPGLLTQLAGSIAVPVSYGWRVVELGYPDARLLLYLPYAGTAYRLDPAPPLWSAIQYGGSDLTVGQAATGLNGVWLVGQNAAAAPVVYRSWDGVTWNAMALGAITSPQATVVFDQRLFVLNRTPTATPQRYTYTLYASTDVAAAAAGGGTWTAGNSFVTPQTELVAKLFVWQYPPDRGRATIWCLSSAGLRYYDYYAATPVWQEFYAFRSPLLGSVTLALQDAYVWPKNNNLYTCNAFDEFITEFTGSTIRQLALNRGGGLPLDRRMAPMSLGGDSEWLYAFCSAVGTLGSGTGAVVALTEGGAVHQTAQAFGQPANVLAGGGVGAQDLWQVALGGSTVIVIAEQDNTEQLVAPHLATARSYRPGSATLTTGWLDGNLLNVNKRLLYFELDAIRLDGAPGLDTGCTIEIEYRGRGDAFVSAGTLTDASAFPAVLAVAGGYRFREVQLRVTLHRSTTATLAPFLKTLKVGYRPRPKQRHTYSLRADVRDECPAFQTPDGKFRGRSASTLRLFLDEVADNDDAGLDDPLVGLSYGGRGNSLHPRYRSVPQCEVLVQAQESVDKADGLYLVTLNDVSAPTSG